MRNTSQKAVELIQLRYSTLLLEKEIKFYKDNQEEGKIDINEFDTIKNILELLDYIDKNIENGTINDKFLNSNKDIESLKKEINSYALFISKEKFYNQAKLLADKITSLEKDNIINNTFDDNINLFNLSIEERLFDIQVFDMYVENLLNLVGYDNVCLMFKYLNDDCKIKLFSGIISHYSLRNKDLIKKYILNLLKEYSFLHEVKLENYQVSFIIKSADIEYLKMLDKLNILKFNEMDFNKILTYILQYKRYDLGLFLYDNCKIYDNFHVLRDLLEQSPDDDMNKVNELFISIIKNKKFSNVTKEDLCYIKETIMDDSFGKTKYEQLPCEEKLYDDSVTELLDDVSEFLNELLEIGYIEDEETQSETEDLIADVEEQSEFIKKGNKDVIDSYNDTIPQSTLVIDKQKFVEDVFSSLIDKTPVELHSYLLEIYDEIINKDEMICKQRCVKTLNKILKKNDKQIQ